ncbi:Ig-like domain-containing protein, partial [Cellulomonas denverensis]
VSGGQIGTARTLEFTAGDPDLTADGTSTLAATTGDRAADGADRHTVTATVRDALGNPVSGAEVVFALPEGGPVPASGTTTMRTDSSGVAKVDLVSTVAGTFEVTATVNGAPLLNGSPARVSFIGGPVSAQDSTLTVAPQGPLPVGREAGNTYTATVTTRDTLGNAVTGIPVSFEIVDASGAVVTEPLLSATSVQSDAEGRAVVTVNSTLAGEFTLRALVNRELVGGQGATVSWTAGTASAEKSALTVTGGVVEADGVAAHRATVTVVDGYGNPVSGVEVDFGIAAGAQLSAASAVSGSDGTASVEITSTTAGEYAVSAHMSGAEVSGSPQTVEFGHGAGSAIRSTWTVTPQGSLPVGEEFTATVTVNDTNGNPVSGAVVGLQVPDGVTTGAAGPYVTGQDGTVSVTLTSWIAGEYPVSVWLGADQIGEQKTLVFAAGEVSTTESQIEATTPVQANGKDTSTVTVTLRDDHGNAVTAAHQVDVTSTLGTVGPVKANGDGTYTATVSSLTAGVSAIGFSIDGTVAAQSAQVTFVATPATPVVDPTNGKQVTGTTEPGTTVTFEDGNGTPIPGELVVNPDGSFVFTPDSPLPDGTKVVVTAVDENGFESDPAVVIVDAIAPDAP